MSLAFSASIRSRSYVLQCIPFGLGGNHSVMMAALGGRTILSEFPELCGVEQSLIDRSATKEIGNRFIQLMSDYAARAKAVHSGFEMNPSPGNIKDGLLTDAMKSAGAARKGGTSPVTAVIDYPEYARESGLNLQCTPGNDVECVTAQVGAGANVVLFTTGLGTPTGNPVAPVVKIATNSSLAQRMVVTGGHDGRNTGEMGRMCDGGQHLRRTYVRSAEHPNFSVCTWQARGPFNSVVAII